MLTGSPISLTHSPGVQPFGIGVNVIDNKAATPLVQQFTWACSASLETITSFP